MIWENKLVDTLQWTKSIVNLAQKEELARKIADCVQEGDVIGVGSGSTSFLALLEIGKKVSTERLNVVAIPTSHEGLMACTFVGLPTSTLMSVRPDWYFDGADEVDPQHNLIKGRGGAMYAEKLLMRSSPKTYILVDPSKFVTRLGEKAPIPVEVDPQALHFVVTQLDALGAKEVQLRMAEAKDGPVITERGNLILDVRFKQILKGYEQALKAIPGVLESGLFMENEIEVFTAE